MHMHTAVVPLDILLGFRERCRCVKMRRHSGTLPRLTLLGRVVHHFLQWQGPVRSAEETDRGSYARRRQRRDQTGGREN